MPAARGPRQLSEQSRHGGISFGDALPRGRDKHLTLKAKPKDNDTYQWVNGLRVNFMRFALPKCRE